MGLHVSGNCYNLDHSQLLNSIIPFCKPKQFWNTNNFKLERTIQLLPRFVPQFTVWKNQR